MHVDSITFYGQVLVTIVEHVIYAAAKMIMQEFKSKFPDTLEYLQTLPGIGRSTAGAILSIAFNQQAAILDGNVKRVLARFHGITQPINEKKIEETL